MKAKKITDNKTPKEQKKLNVPQKIPDPAEIVEKQPYMIDETPMKFRKVGDGERKYTATIHANPEQIASMTELDLYKITLKEVVGVKDSELASHILDQASAAILPLVGESGKQLNIMVQSLNDIKPKDAIEARLVAQSAVFYVYAMNSLMRCGQADMLMHIEAMANLSIKLARANNETIETLNRYRRGGEQKVTVTHAVLANQAIVNNFQGEGAQPKNQGDTPCQQCAEPKPEPTKTNPVLSQPWLTDDVDSTVEKVLAPNRKKGKTE